jgi:hypothetical protein
MVRRVPSVVKVEAAIGWRAAVDLDATLCSVIEYERGMLVSARS